MGNAGTVGDWAGHPMIMMRDAPRAKRISSESLLVTLPAQCRAVPVTVFYLCKFSLM